VFFLKWCSEENEENEEEFYKLFSVICWKSKDYVLSNKYFLNTNDCENFTKMLLDWSNSINEDPILLLTRSVLQYLSFGNLKNANKLFENFNNNLRSNCPLTRFLQLLLLTLERDAFTLFQSLCEQYQYSLSRNQEFSKYLQQISQIFYSRETQQTGGIGGIFGEVLKGMFE